MSFREEIRRVKSKYINLLSKTSEEDGRLIKEFINDLNLLIKRKKG